MSTSYTRLCIVLDPSHANFEAVDIPVLAPSSVVAPLWLYRVVVPVVDSDFHCYSLSSVDHKFGKRRGNQGSMDAITII